MDLRRPFDALDRLIDVVPPAGPARRLVAVSLVDSVGTGFFLAGSAIFFVRVLGLSAAQVGLGLAVSSLVGFLTTVPLGMLSDRLGPRRMLVLLHGWRGAWTAVLPWADGILAFTVVASLLAVAECAIMPLTRSLVSDAMGAQDRTRTLGFMRSWRNGGFALGAALTTPLIAADSRAAYTTIVLINAVSCLAAAVVVGRIPLLPAEPADPAEPAAARPDRTRPLRPRIPLALRDRPYLALTLLDAALMTHVTLLSVAVPLWVTGHTAAPTAVVPILILTNTALAVALQVRFASQGESSRAGRTALQRAGLCLAACCLLLAPTGATSPAGTVVLLVLAVVALTAGELWEAAGSWSLSYRFARTDRESEYLSVFSLGSTAQYVVAPVVLTSLVLDAHAVGWIALAGAFVAVALTVRPVVAWLDRAAGRTGPAGPASGTPPTPPPPTPPPTAVDRAGLSA